MAEPSKINVSVRPQRNLVLSKDELNVLFEVNSSTLPQPDEYQPAIDLVVVLDVSGSMNGDKLEFAKQATVEVINLLQKWDTFHLVTFQSSVEVVVKNGDLNDRQGLIDKVKLIRAGGGTNLIEGIERGFEVLQSTENQLRRMFLFSDGNADVKQGILERVEEFVSKGVTISSFGIGDGFDEDLMRGIAERGSGDYFFMEFAHQIPVFVSNAIRGLTQLIGTKALFTFLPENGTTLDILYGPENEGAKSYDFGDVTADNQRCIVVKLGISAPGEGLYIAGKWQITYYSIRGTSAGTSITLSGDLELRCIPDMQSLEGHHDDLDVLIAVKIKESGKKDRMCKQLLDQGQLEEVIAIKKSQLEELKEFADNVKIGRLIELGTKVLEELEQERTGRGLSTYVGSTGGGKNWSPKSPLMQKSKVANLKKVRKCFDSGDYYCRNDNNVNWQSSMAKKDK